MSKLVIDLRAASVPWAGSWWAAEWAGVPLGTHRDPARVIARLFLKARKAKRDDVIVLRVDGQIIDQEVIGEATGRKLNPERLSTRLLLMTLDQLPETPAQ